MHIDSQKMGKLQRNPRNPRESAGTDPKNALFFRHFEEYIPKFSQFYSNRIQSTATRACMIWHASNQSSSTMPFQSGFAARSSAYS